MIYIQISHLFLKALTTLIKGFPKTMAQWLPEILPSIWNIFTQSADMYPFQSAWKFLSLKTCQYILKNDLNNFFICTIQGSELEKTWCVTLTNAQLCEDCSQQPGRRRWPSRLWWYEHPIHKNKTLHLKLQKEKSENESSMESCKIKSHAMSDTLNKHGSYSTFTAR